MSVEHLTLVDITVVYSPAPREVIEWTIALPEGSTMGVAIASVMHEAFPGLDTDTLVAGVWGRQENRSVVLKSGDRVELYRPLTVDPKVARRKRFKSQGVRGAGLFAKKKTGRESGY